MSCLITSKVNGLFAVVTPKAVIVELPKRKIKVGIWGTAVIAVHVNPPPFLWICRNHYSLAVSIFNTLMITYANIISINM